MTGAYVNIIFILALYISVFSIAEFLYRRGAPSYVTRKIAHIGGAVVTALLPMYVPFVGVIAIGVVFSLFLFASKRSSLLQSVHNTQHDSIGALLFVPSLTLSALIFLPISLSVFQGVVLILGLADGLAGIIGKTYGTHSYSITGTKTFEGSAVFFVTSCIVLYGMVSIEGVVIGLADIMAIAFGALLVTATEAIFGKGWDNLFIPLFAGLVLLYII